MKPVSLFVLATQVAEVESARNMTLEDATYLCSRRDVFLYCQSKKLNSILLHDDMLFGCQPEINSWGYRATLTFLEKLKAKSDDPQKIFWEANYCTIKGVLVHALKFIVVLDALIQEYQIKKLWMFRSPRSLFVNTWCEYVAQYRPDVQTSVFQEACAPVSANRWFHISKDFPRRIVAKISNFRSSIMLCFRSKKKSIVISGALNHLSSVVALLKKRNISELVFLESDFNYEKFLFCLKNGIPFMVFSRDKKSWDLSLLRDSLSSSGGLFVFRDVDYSIIFRKLLQIALDVNFIECPFDYSAMERTFRCLRPACILLDEDLSPVRRGLAGLAGQNKLESFVVSHGLPGLPVREDKHAAQFCETHTTFVNSDLEKAAYGNLCFDPSKMAVLGTPRYDEMFSTRTPVNSPNVQAERENKVILLCLSVINHYEFDEVHWILAEITAMGEMNRAYIKDLLDVASKRNDVLIKIKPHYNNEQRDVERYVAGLMSQAKYSVESYRASTHELEAEADLIVTPESTVIVEAVILRKPVIVMNYGRLDAWSFFKTIRPVIYVRNKDALHEMVSRVLNDDHFADSLYEKSEDDTSFVNKFADAKNTERVVNHILTHIV